MIQVLVIVTTKPGARSAVLDACRRNVPAVLNETGNLNYQAAIDLDGSLSSEKLGPDSFVLLEQWSSVEAFQAHRSAPHMIAYQAAVSAMILNRVVYVLGTA